MFFPLYPVKVFKSTFLIVLIASVFGIRLLLQLLSFRIPGFGISVSFGWLPVYVIGWFFGPLIGLVFGALADTTAWVISGDVWFWMYAIQEPVVGLIAGFVGWLFIILQTKAIKTQIILQKIVVFFFILFTIFIVIFQFSKIENNVFAEASTFSNEKIFVILLCVFLIAFLIINEAQNYYMYRQYRQSKIINNYSAYLFVSLMIIFCICLFSFALGPITQVKYLEFVNGKTPNGYLQYGTMYYLIPRVLKEAFKTPIYIVLTFSVIVAIKYQLNQMINNLKTKWK